MTPSDLRDELAKVIDHHAFEPWDHDRGGHEYMLRSKATQDVRQIAAREKADRILSFLAERQWQPRETAPMDGTPILLAVIDPEHGAIGYVEHGSFEVLAEDEDDGPWEIRGGEPHCTYVGRAAGTYWNCWFSTTEYENRYRVDESKDFARFTHWMPLPASPVAGAASNPEPPHDR